MKFDIEIHKKTHHGYLEVMISPSGEIEYAIPSHQMYLMQKAKEITNLTEDEINKLCPNEYYCDFMRWLFFISRYLPVWENFVLDNVQITRAQCGALKSLKVHGLYKGKLPEIKPLSRCPICGAEAERSEVSLNGRSEYKYNCSNTALHISCGGWFNTKLKAQQDWERRCTGYGQPEFYKPTNEEHIRSIIRRNSGAQLIDAIRDIYKPISAYSSREAAARWLAMRYVPDKCVGCAKNQREYCICTKEENQK